MSPVDRRTNRYPQRRQPRSRRSGQWIWLAVFIVIVGAIWFFTRPRHPAGQTAQRTDTVQPATSKQPDTTPSLQQDPQLAQLISTWAHKYSFHSSVVVQELTGNQPRTATYQATDSVVPASTYKIYVAYAILHGVEQGNYTLSTKTDDGHTIQADLENMILNSNNDAARALGFKYGWKNINALLATQGITNTNLYNYIPPSTQPQGDKHTTATDLASVLQKLYTGRLLNQAHTTYLLTLLKTQHFRERIPAGVPSSVTVADKPGWLGPADGENGYTENDAAIVYGPKSTYILVITTTGSSTQPLANLSQLVYNYLES